MGETRYADPVKVLRDHVKEMGWKAEKLSREARDLDLRAGTIRSEMIEIDLLVDKIEQAITPTPTTASL